jgi:hypothetical protein
MSLMLKIGLAWGFVSVIGFYAWAWFMDGRPPFIPWITGTLPRDE